MPELGISDLRTGYGQTDVLHGVSLHVERGECVGLFGPNGHGKTTLLRCISGLLPARTGAITYRGTPIHDRPPREIVERGLVHVPQGNTLFPEMTVLENLHLGAYPNRARSGSRKRLERVYALFPRLAERKQQRVKTLSGGERQMTSIGVGLMSNPELLMLDEPTLGLAPKLKDELGDAIAAIAAGDTSLLVVEQDLEFLQRLSNRMYMLNHGEVTQEFDSTAPLEHERIMEMYFSKGHA